MTDPAITVIVPGLDVAPYVPAALDSLRNQTRGDWCAILIDDGSTDETGDLFERAAARDERFRALRLPRTRGLGAARNAGLELVTTPFVGFLDADDEFTPRALERMVGTLEHCAGQGDQKAVQLLGSAAAVQLGKQGTSQERPQVRLPAKACEGSHPRAGELED